MTDEEMDSEGNDVLIKCRGSTTSDQSFKKLDERYLLSREKKSNSKPRKICHDSDRLYCGL